MAEPEANGAQEDRSIAELMRHYEGALRRFFSRRVDSAEQVDDLVQEAFARMFESAEQRDVQYPVAYLFRIASNLLADRSRMQARRPVHAEFDEHSCSAAVAPDQEHSRNLADLRASLEMALAGLSPKCRDIFIMRRFHDLSTSEIARALGITDRMVQKHMTRAMTHIYLCLKGLPPHANSRHGK